jgi:glycosyltransferase involved in cell wall biosynthesis
MGLTKIEMPLITVKYIPLSSNRVKSYLLFFIASKKYIVKEKFDLIFHIDANFTLFIRILNLFSPMVLDIRSGDLSDNQYILWYRNKLITISSRFYRKISVISKSLSKELKLNLQKTTLLPLGGELQLFNPKQFESIKLLYIGSLNNRNVEQTIIGFSYFKLKNPNIEISYDIIGFGSESIETELENTIVRYKMSGFIKFHGRKKYPDIVAFLDDCNVGVVYIPQKRYYDFQPSTKLYESLLAGMPVIATNTLENRQSLIKDCGVLCEDNPISFSKALEIIIQKKGNYNSQKIKQSYLESDWRYIVDNIWTPFILEAIKALNP